MFGQLTETRYILVGDTGDDEKNCPDQHYLQRMALLPLWLPLGGSHVHLKNFFFLINSWIMNFSSGFFPCPRFALFQDVTCHTSRSWHLLNPTRGGLSTKFVSFPSTGLLCSRPWTHRTTAATAMATATVMHSGGNKIRKESTFWRAFSLHFPTTGELQKIPLWDVPLGCTVTGKLKEYHTFRSNLFANSFCPSSSRTRSSLGLIVHSDGSGGPSDRWCGGISPQASKWLSFGAARARRLNGRIRETCFRHTPPRRGNGINFMDIISNLKN